jgi:pimeloyl-ACP methyl ester carboxylesterase
MDATTKAILVPGAVLPADLAYPALREHLGDDVEALTTDLVVYATDEPPPEYTLEAEVDSILRAADRAGFGRFHLVGYSAGGAASVYLASLHPERLASLALLEPAWAGNVGLRPAEVRARARLAEVLRLAPAQRMPAFVAAQLAPGVEPPPPPAGPAPPWMAKRPAGLAALVGAFGRATLDLDVLRRFERPVYFALGGGSNPELYAPIAERLATIFPDFTLERFEDRHHFDPPHRKEPERLARSLRVLWARADGAG